MKTHYECLINSINEEISEIENQKKKLAKEKEEFEEMTKKISSVHFSSTIKLDVGGHQFKTSLTTLRKEDSMLARMFSGSGFLVEKDEDGYYFIDRPGLYFAPILHYLQTGVFLEPQDAILKKGIKIEADFFQVQNNSFLIILIAFYFISNILSNNSPLFFLPVFFEHHFCSF